nr:hypothetical protein [Rubellimicrobium mesophilum]
MAAPTDLPRGLDAAHHRHLDIHEDEIEAFPRDALDSLGPVAGQFHAKTQKTQQPLGHGAVDRIVLHQKDAAPIDGLSIGFGLPALGRPPFAGPRLGHRQLEPEGASVAQGAADSDTSAEALGDPPADGEAEPCPAIAAGGRAVDLAELAEQHRHGLLGDADPGVGDLDPEAVRRAEPACHHDRALRRELHGVPCQVDQELPQPRGVRPYLDRREVDPQGHAARVHAGRQHRAEGVRDLGQRDAMGLELHLARLELGEVEDVGDDLEQMIARLTHHGEEAPLVGRHRRSGQELRGADDAVQGCPDLVAHGGEEGGFRPARRPGPQGDGAVALAQEGELAAHTGDQAHLDHEKDDDPGEPHDKGGDVHAQHGLESSHLFAGIDPRGAQRRVGDQHQRIGALHHGLDPRLQGDEIAPRQLRRGGGQRVHRVGQGQDLASGLRRVVADVLRGVELDREVAFVQERGATVEDVVGLHDRRQVGGVAGQENLVDDRPQAGRLPVGLEGGPHGILADAVLHRPSAFVEEAEEVDCAEEQQDADAAKHRQAAPQGARGGPVRAAAPAVHPPTSMDFTCQTERLK